MKLYHGSIEIIKIPVILDKQRLLDFGKGFYTTTNREQAERWAILKQRREGKTAKALVSVYEFNDNNLTSSIFNILIFRQASEEWLDFVISNRNEENAHEYDMVIGPVANDTLYQTLSLYEAGILTKPETIARLKVHPLYDQIAFNTSKIMPRLVFESAYEVL